MQRRKLDIVVMLLVSIALLSASAWGEEENYLTRDEVTVIKKKLVAIFTALGDAPKGYGKEDENFNLPTRFYKDRSSGKINPIQASASQRFGGGAEKKMKKSEKELGEYYRKKMLEAQAKNDMDEMMRLSQEMQMEAERIPRPFPSLTLRCRRGVKNKTTILNATIRISGPADIVDAWAKKIDTKGVLAQIDAGR
ncbi:MAG: hypothetical protein A2W23_08510 [Planctomycetes bacterium RBG_16_43_13]|nr:MAG: hypothetical protein A2W23_08510 [Planctomycetes bacterium RBG_16_43_13]